MEMQFDFDEMYKKHLSEIAKADLQAQRHLSSVTRSGRGRGRPEKAATLDTVIEDARETMHDEFGVQRGKPLSSSWAYKKDWLERKKSRPEGGWLSTAIFTVHERCRIRSQ